MTGLVRPQAAREQYARVTRAHASPLDDGTLPDADTAAAALAGLTYDFTWVVTCLGVLMDDESMDDMPEISSLLERVAWRVELAAARRKLLVLDANRDPEAEAEAEADGGELSDAVDRRQTQAAVAFYEQALAGGRPAGEGGADR